MQEVEPGQSYQFRYRIQHGDHQHFLNDPEADGSVASLTIKELKTRLSIHKNRLFVSS